MHIEPGSKAPDFTMETLAGPKSLASYAGRKLVLYFYPKDDTSGCTSQAKAFSALKPAFSDAGAEILGVSRDSIAKHGKFTEKHALTINLATDPEAETVANYGSWVEKNMYGRKYMGIDRSTFLIAPDGTIAQIWRKVRIPGHVDAVLAAVRALG